MVPFMPRNMAFMPSPEKTPTTMAAGLPTKALAQAKNLA